MDKREEDWSRLQFIVVFENLLTQQFFKVANFGIILERRLFDTKL